MDTPLEIVLFGPMRVQIDGQPLPKLRSRKGLWLLAYLALRDGTPVVRERLAFTFWPDAEPSAALSSLRSVVSDLRQALGVHHERLSSPTRDTLAFDVHDLTIDALQFDRAIRGRDLSRAVDAYRGDLLEGCPEEWAHGERRFRQEQVLTALLALAKEAASTNPTTSAEFCRRAIAIDALRDEPVRGLMNALASMGDLNGALHEYREFAHRLRREEGGVPDEQTTDLYERLRKGKGKLRNVPVEKKPTETDQEPTPLPRPLSPLVGREDETTEILATLRRFRIVSLVGVGGIGKTRLAIEVASEARSRFTDGVWFVSLEAAPSGGEIVRTVADALGVREELGVPTIELLVRKLRTKRALLVLDNCEHVMPACAALCHSLLPSCGEVRLLMTSREALRIAGESVFTVPGLPVPILEHLPASGATRTRVALGYESVALFVARAQSASPQFSLDADNAATVAEICTRLEGIPLAIELAAVQAGSMSVASIAKRLQEMFGASETKDWGYETRQRTMRSTLDWSYALLSPDEQRVLRRLAFFKGGWTVDAAESIVSDPALPSERTSSIFRSLVAKSLIVFDLREDRYRFLEPVRQYANEKLSSDVERSTVRDAHRAWFVRFAEEAAKGLDGPEMSVWMTKIEMEAGNFLSAMDDGAAGLRIADAMGRFWYVRGEFELGYSTVDRLLAHNSEPTGARRKALHRVAVLLCCLWRFGDARERCEEALSIALLLEDRFGEGEAKNVLASLAHESGDHDAETLLLEESAEIFRELGYRRGVATALSNTATCALSRGAFAQSRPAFQEALAISEEIDDVNGCCVIRLQLGGLETLLGDFDAARLHFDECLRVQESLHSKRGVAMARYGLGAIEARLAHPVRAREHLLAALSLFREVGDRWNESVVLCLIADLDAGEHRLAAASDLLKTSLAISREFGDKGIIASGLRISARVSRLCGDLPLAAIQAKDSLRLADEAKVPQIALDALDELGLVQLELGEPLRATKLWGRSRSLRESMRIPTPPNRIEELQGALDKACRQLGSAEFEESLRQGATVDVRISELPIESL